MTGPAPQAELEMRPATSGDARLLFTLRNDPFIVALSRSGSPVAWADHEAWFAGAIAAPDRHRIFFLEHAGETVGVLRFVRHGAEAAEMTIYLLERATGRGYGTLAIREGSELIARTWPIGRVLAHVIAGNRPSLRAFAKAGFVPAGPADAAAGWTMVLPLP